MPDARPLVVAYGRAAARNSANWRLRARWPLEWLTTHGVVDFLEIDETGAYGHGRGPSRPEALRDAPPGPVMAFAAFIDAHAVRALRTRGYRIVIGVDDDHWSVPEWSPNAGDHTEELGTMEAVLAESDVVVVTTEPLAGVVVQFASPRAVRVIPNALPVDRVPLSRPNLGPKIRIGWAGSATHRGDWDAVRTPIEALLERPEVRLVLLTENVPSWLRHPHVELHKPVGFDRYYEKLAALHLDVGMAPLVAHVFNESKSNLKMLEYASLGLPPVASRVGPYADLPHGETCLTVPDNNPDAWLEALTALIENPARRRAMGQAARAWVETHGSLDTTGPAWAEVLGLSTGIPDPNETRDHDRRRGDEL